MRVCAKFVSKNLDCLGEKAIYIVTAMLGMKCSRAAIFGRLPHLSAQVHQNFN